MAFNTQFGGLDLSPAFIFPESQSYGNVEYPLNPVEEPLPWQPYNRWVFPSAIVEDHPGASQLPAEGRRGPLDEVYASSSLSPASNLLLGDNPSPLATFAGSSSSMAQNNHAGPELYMFGLPAQDAPPSSWDYFARPRESFSRPLPNDALEGRARVAEYTPHGAGQENTAPVPDRETIDKDPFMMRFHLSPAAGAQEWPGIPSGLHGDIEFLQVTQIVGALPEPSRGYASDLSGPSSHPPSQPTVHDTAREPTAPMRTRTKGRVALAGPSYFVPIAPREATVQAEAPAATQLRRSSRKRASPTTSYAESAALPPPPSKKRKGSNGKASVTRRHDASAVSYPTEQEGPVAGPSRQAAGVHVASPQAGAALSARKARPAKASPKNLRTKPKRARRTREEVNKYKVTGMLSQACDVEGCEEEWNPYTHDENRTHLEGHFDVGDLKSSVDLVCVFDACQEVVPGKGLLKHMEENHLGRPYLCPIGWGFTGCRDCVTSRDMHGRRSWTPEATERLVNYAIWDAY
ncbi:hypothetical protein VTO73DRAFT_11261 [Trametes versicolor]